MHFMTLPDMMLLCMCTEGDFKGGSKRGHSLGLWEKTQLMCNCYEDEINEDELMLTFH